MFFTAVFAKNKQIIYFQHLIYHLCFLQIQSLKQAFHNSDRIPIVQLIQSAKLGQEMSEPQYAEIKLPFGSESLIVHCPVCGQATVEPEYGVVDKPCSHLVFIYVGRAGEYAFMSDSFKERIGNCIEEHDHFCFEIFPKLLKKAGYRNSLLALEIAYGGMACGPVSDKVVYGFDFEEDVFFEEDEEDES